MGLHDKQLLLFFTRGMSLARWDHGGALEREVEIYRRLAPHLGGIAFLTYGDSSESRYARAFDGIQVRYNRWNLPRRVFAQLAPLLFAPTLARCAVFKTNQTDGSEVALAAKRIFRKKLITRCGYMWSLNALERAEGEVTDAVRRARRREREAFRAADRVVVTTPSMKEYAVEQYALEESKVWVIPNYVLTDTFKPQQGRAVKRKRMCFIGRLDEAKDPMLLLEAMRGLNVELVMIGNGGLRPTLEAKAAQFGLNVQFLGTIPHHDLPAYLNSSTAFVSTSRYENHPKTLLEATACGLPVVGTDVRGTRDVIQHGVTGFLCERSPESVRDAISTLLGDEALAQRLGRNAREYAVENFDIERVLKLELELLHSLFSDN